MKIHYLEIVTKKIEQLCETYGDIYNISFSDPVPELGLARVAELYDGGHIGIRAPMSPDETEVTRPYFKVENIQEAINQAEKAGADIIHPPLEIPGLGRFAICLTGGIQHGFWET